MADDDEREIFGFPGKYKSPVWESFGFYKFDDGSLDRSHAICRHCRKPISYSGNTTNLHLHMSNHHHLPQYHTTPHSVVKRSKQNSNTGRHGNTRAGNRKLTDFMSCTSSKAVIEGTSQSFSMDNGILWPNDEDKKPDIGFLIGQVTEQQMEFDCQPLVVKYLIEDLQPVSTVDSPAFKNLIQVLNSQCILPNSEALIKNVFPVMYSEIRDTIVSVLRTADTAVYLKVALWKAVTLHYVTISAQFFVSPWKLKSYVLKTYNSSSEFTSKEVKDCLQDVISDWNLIGSPVVLSASDGVTATATRELEFLNVQCLSDRIDKVAVLALTHPVMKTLVSHARQLVKYFMEDTTRKSLLYEKQTLLNLPQQKLVMDTEEAWIKSYEMLNTLNEQTAAIFAVFSDPYMSRRHSVNLFTAQEQVVMHSLLSILKELKTAMTYISGLNFCTAAVILPVVHKLHLTLKHSDCDAKVICEIKKSVCKSLMKGYMSNSVLEYLLLCCILDPRFKDLKFLEQADRDRAVSLLHQKASRVANTQQVVVKQEPVDTVYEQSHSNLSQNASGSVDEPVIKKSRHKRPDERDAAIEDWLDDVVISAGSREGNSAVDEVNRYIAEPQAPSKCSPLKWWSERQFVFPGLTQLVKKYVCAPAVLTEKSVSEQELYQKRRLCLSEENVDMMLFLHHNSDK